MGEDPCTCDDAELVAVKDRNMAPVYVAGNPYSRYCLGCGRRYFCKSTYWKDALKKYIIPRNDDEPVPADEYDDENFFECPQCGEPQFGLPDDCEACDQEYDWPEES